MDIGASLKRTCNFDLSKLINPQEYPRNANVFYEMFLEDYNGDLIDVPVLIRNYKHENIYDNLDADKTRWKLVRRFFIYDTVSGISQSTGGSYVDGSPPAVVRFAQSVKIKIDLDPNDNERIFPPYLEITYKVVEAKEIENKENRLQTVEFAAEYNDSNDFEDLRTITFIVLMCIMGLMILFYFGIDLGCIRRTPAVDDKVGGGQAEPAVRDDVLLLPRQRDAAAGRRAEHAALPERRLEAEAGAAGGRTGRGPPHVVKKGRSHREIDAGNAFVVVDYLPPQPH